MFQVLPGITGVPPDQFQNLADVDERAISEDEELSRAATMSRLVVHPGQCPQQVTATQIRMQLLYII